MKHLFEYEEKEIIDLYKDLIDLGVSGDRVTLDLKYKSYVIDAIHYKLKFPELDNRQGEIRDIDILGSLLDRNFYIDIIDGGPILTGSIGETIARGDINMLFSGNTTRNTQNLKERNLVEFLNHIFLQEKDLLEMNLIVDLKQRLYLNRR